MEIRNNGNPMIPAGSHQSLQKAQNCSSAKSYWYFRTKAEGFFSQISPTAKTTINSTQMKIATAPDLFPLITPSGTAKDYLDRNLTCI